MRQALHIFKKDVRFLRVEIVLLLALAMLLALAETLLHPAAVVAELLVIAAVNYTIARVIHAEAIPGHNQFWITRPYRWQSLLGAKILFILIFVNVPLFAAQCYMVSAENFSLTANFAGLIWSQVILVSCVSLPVACLASLTASLMPFLFSEFILVSVVVIAEGLHVRATPSAFLPAMQSGPAAVDWVRDSLALVIVTCVALYVLRSQYKTRLTNSGAWYAIGGTLIALLAFLCMPWTFALGVQAELSKRPFDTSSLNISLGPVTKGVFPFPGPRDKPHPGEISLPFVITGVTAGNELQADAMSVQMVAADGRTWNSGSIVPIMVDTGPPIPGATVVAEILHVDPGFFEPESRQPVTLRTRLYLTLFGDAQSMTIPVEREPGVNVMDGLQCFAESFFHQLNCRSLFRWPRRRVYARTGDGGMDSFIRSISYSPFPAVAGFNPIEQHSFSSVQDATQATITTKAPLSYFHVDSEISGVRLPDYTDQARRKALMAPPPPGIR